MRVAPFFVIVLLVGLCTGVPVGLDAQEDAAPELTWRFRIAAYNVKHGLGMDDRVDLERVADVLRGLDADVITLQEVDDRTERTGGVDQVAVIAGLLGYEGRHGPHRPYQGGFYGNAVLTRLPVAAQRTHPIPPASGSALAVHETVVGTPTFDRDPAGTAILSELLFSVVSVHLAGTEAERVAQAESVTRTFAESGLVILAGDFNGRPDDAAVRGLAGEWTIGEKSGDPRTYPSPDPDREIDFVMWRFAGDAGRRIEIELIDHRVVDEPMASDHRPIVADFEIRVR